MDIFGFVLFMFVAIGTPGPNNIMLLTSGVNFGYKKTIPHIMGIVVGFSTMIFLVGVGGAQVLEAFPEFYTILRYIGIIYLFYLAFKIATTESLSREIEESSKPFSFLQAALFQWVNPKAWLIATNIILLFLQPVDISLYFLIAIMCIIFIVIGFFVGSIWTFFGVQLKRFLRVSKYSRIFNFSMAVLLVFSFIFSLF